MSRSTQLALGAVVALPLLASCTSEFDMPDSPTVYTADTSDVGEEMGIGGALTLIEGVCYGVGPVDGEGFLRPVIFPEGVVAEGDQGIRTPSGELIRIGDVVRGSGLPSDPADSHAVEAGLPAECAVEDVVDIMGDFNSSE